MPALSQGTLLRRGLAEEQSVHSEVAAERETWRGHCCVSTNPAKACHIFDVAIPLRMRALQARPVRNYTCHHYYLPTTTSYPSRTLSFLDTGFSCAPQWFSIVLNWSSVVLGRSPSATLSWTGDLKINKSRLRTIEKIKNYTWNITSSRT